MNTIKLANEPSNGLNLISLFAGCGGSSLGYKSAGYDIRLSVEWDKGAAETYRDNFPGTPVYEGDIGDLSIDDAIKLSGVSPGELDVLDGSPPCQGFSTAGSRHYTDDRNQLFREYVRILKGYMPRAFIMENVSGLRKGKMKLMFAEMTKALKDSGYRVACRELNAWWYGVPQSRARLIWVGIREDLPFKPSHPKPVLRRPVSVRQALGDHIVVSQTHIWGKGQEQSAKEFPTVRAIKKSVFEKQSKWVNINEPAKTLVATRPPLLAGSFSFPQNAERDGKTLDKPSGTLAAIRPPTITDGVEIRYINIEEAKALQSFPEDFRIEKYKYIGNSVPPLMAEAVGKHLAGILNDA